MRRNIKGYSLIELCVVMVILGFITSGVFAYMSVELEQKKLEGTRERTADNATALQKFTTSGQQKDAAGQVLLDSITSLPLLEKRFPCPAPANVGIGQAGFGVESCPSIAAAPGVYNGVTVTQNALGQTIFIGALPVATLELGLESFFDEYHAPYIYAVTAALTPINSVTNSNPAGAISVRAYKNIATPTLTDAPFIVLATAREKTLAVTSDEDENTDGDDLFNAFNEVYENSMDYYDDYALYDFPDQNSSFCVSRIDQQTYFTPGNYTWTKPANLQYVQVEAVGAQGGLKGFWFDFHCSSQTRSGMQNLIAGQAGKAVSIFKDNELPSTVSVSVGAGGLGGGPYGSPVPQNGGLTSFGGFISITGSGAGMINNVMGTAGVATGAEGTYTPIGVSGYVAPTDSNPTGSSCSTMTGTVAGGRGNDGAVLVTSYICD